LAVGKDNQHTDHRRKEEVDHGVVGNDDEDEDGNEDDGRHAGAVVDNVLRQRACTEACRGDVMEAVLHYYNQAVADNEDDETTVVVVVVDRDYEHAEVDRRIHKHRNAKQK